MITWQNDPPRVEGMSPWGKVQDAEEVAPGIISVTTPSHGGMWLSDERRAQMPEALRAVPTTPGGNWYEQDVDAMLVILSFPDLFDGRYLWTLLDGMAYRWAGDRIRRAIEGWRGASRMRAEDRAKAWGDEHTDWWLRGSCSTGGDGWRVWFQQVGTGDRALRHLTGDEYLELPAVVPELPGEPAGASRKERQVVK